MLLRKPVPQQICSESLPVPSRDNHPSPTKKSELYAAAEAFLEVVPSPSS